MRILFLSNYYPPFHRGGYEELCADVAEGLADRGHQVGILTSDIGKNSDESALIPVFRRLQLEIDGPPIIVSLRTVVGIKKRLLNNLRQTELTINEFRPDGIMIWGMWNLSKSIAKHIELYRKPATAYFISDLWPALPNSITQHWQNPPQRRILAQPKKMLGAFLLASNFAKRYDEVELAFENTACVSNAVRQELVKKNIIPPGSVVINNGIRTEDFQDKHANYFEKRGSESELKLLYAGRVSCEKGIETAINAIEILKAENIPISLDIVGGGDRHYLEGLSSAVQQKGLCDEIHFTGRVMRENMPVVYNRSDVLLIPSTGSDALPRTLLEGMSSGCIAIGSNVGGIPEVIENNVNGFLFEPGDFKALADIVVNIYKNPATLSSIRKASKKTVVTRFALDRYIGEIENFLAEIVM